MEFDLSNGWLLNWVILSSIFTLALVSPGPDFIMTVRNAVFSGRVSGLSTAAGIATGLWVHIIYVIIGLAALIEQSIFLFNLIKYAGAGYLIYMGIRAIQSGGFSSEKINKKPKRILSPINSFTTGFLTNLLNPKAMLFFLAVFSQFIEPDMPVWIKLLYGGTCVFITFTWYSIVTIFLTHPMLKNTFLKISHWLDRVCGIALIALGLKLAFTSK